MAVQMVLRMAIEILLFELVVLTVTSIQQSMVQDSV